MDISVVSAAVTAAQADTASAVQMAVLKKALDMEGQSALQLVQAATQVSYNNPPNLGNKVDTFA
jgi:hypothetical protein